MKQNGLTAMSVVIVLMVGIIGALCTVTTVMAEEYTNVYIDTNGMTPIDPVIEVGEIIQFNVVYEHNGKNFTLVCGDGWGKKVLASGSNYHYSFNNSGSYIYYTSYSYMDGIHELRGVSYGTIEVVEPTPILIPTPMETPIPVVRRPVVTSTPIVTPTLSPTPTFRVGPNVAFRPVNDVIDVHQDGLVELYMNNPSLNDVTLTADVQVSVPSGISVSGEGFGYGGAAGAVSGTFTVPPGTARTIHINIHGERAGVFTMHFSGLYWADGEKDAFQQISLTHKLTVNEPYVIESKPVVVETSVPTYGSEHVDNAIPDSIPTIYIAVGAGMLIMMMFVALIARR